MLVRIPTDWNDHIYPCTERGDAPRWCDAGAELHGLYSEFCLSFYLILSMLMITIFCLDYDNGSQGTMRYQV